MPGVAGGGGHLEHVLLEAATRLVHREGGEPLHLGLGGDHRDAQALVLLGGAGGHLGGAHGVAVVGQHDDLLGAAPGHRGEQLAGGRAAARPAVDDDRAGLLEERAQPGAGGDRDHPASGAVTDPAARGLDLLGEVGDPDPVRAAGADAGLDGGADVVHVDVHVEQPLAPDHDQRVAERGELGAQRRDPVVVGVEEVHHLVRRAVLGQVARCGSGTGMWWVPSGAVDRASAGGR